MGFGGWKGILALVVFAAASPSLGQQLDDATADMVDRMSAKNLPKCSTLALSAKASARLQAEGWTEEEVMQAIKHSFAGMRGYTLAQLLVESNVQLIYENPPPPNISAENYAEEVEASVFMTCQKIKADAEAISR